MSNSAAGWPPPSRHGPMALPAYSGEVRVMVRCGTIWTRSGWPGFWWQQSRAPSAWPRAPEAARCYGLTSRSLAAFWSASGRAAPNRHLAGGGPAGNQPRASVAGEQEVIVGRVGGAYDVLGGLVVERGAYLLR